MSKSYVCKPCGYSATTKQHLLKHYKTRKHALCVEENAKGVSNYSLNDEDTKDFKDINHISWDDDECSSVEDGDTYSGLHQIEDEETDSWFPFKSKLHMLLCVLAHGRRKVLVSAFSS